MKTLNSLLKAFGESGVPQFVPQSLISTWDAYAKPENTPRERVIRVLGFLHLLHQSGIRMSVPGLNVKRSDKIYETLLQEELVEDAKYVAAELRKLGVFSVCSAFKTMIRVEREMRGGYTLSMTTAFRPKRNEPLDSTLLKLQGMLYYGELPVQLREKWKKLPVKSVARNKSELPKYVDFARASTATMMPIALEDQRSIHAARAKDDFLIIKYVSFKPHESTPWIQPARKHKMVELLFKKSFNNLGS